MADINGNVEKINWNGKELSGTLNLAGLEHLRSLSFYTNQITSLNIAGCTALERIYCNYNSLKKIDLSAFDT